MSEAEALGQRLREAREAKDLSLDDVERATRIRSKFVDALERGDYSSMSTVQAQGFLRNYARFLGEEFELLLEDVSGDKRWRRRGQQAPLPSSRKGAEPTSDLPIPTNPNGPTPRQGRNRQAAARTRVRRGIAGTLFIAIMASAIVFGAVFGGMQIIDRLVDEATSTTPTGSDFLTPSGAVEGGMLDESENMDGPEPFSLPEPTSQFPGVEMTPAEANPGLDSGDGSQSPVITGNEVTVQIRITQTVKVQVTVDGTLEYDNLAAPGEILFFEGQNTIRVVSTSAAGLELTVNNQPLGVMGARGEAFDQTYTLSGSAPPGDATSLLPTDESSPSASPSPATLPFTAEPTVTLGLDPGEGGTGDDNESFAGAPVTDTPAPTLTYTLPPSATTAPSATAANTATPETPTLTLTASATLPPAITPSATATPTETPSPTLTVTPSATPTPSSTPTATRTLTPSLTPSNTPTSTPSLTPTPEFSPTPTAFLPPRLTRTPTPSTKR